MTTPLGHLPTPPHWRPEPASLPAPMSLDDFEVARPGALAGHRAELDEHGFTIIRDLVDPSIVAALLAETRWLEDTLSSAPSNNRFEGADTTRTYNLLAHGELWERIPTEPVVLHLIEHVLGRGCQVSSLASISLAPGETAQVIHTDDQAMPVEKPHAPFVCNSMWALTDFTAENGATNLVPGTHRGPSPDYRLDPETLLAEAIPAEMAAGSVLVWEGAVWHGGGANTTEDEIRVGLAMNYCAGFIRPQENQLLGLAPDRLAAFTPELRQLCGLGMYRGLTGNIDKQAPAALLYGDEPQTQLWDAEPL